MNERAKLVAINRNFTRISIFVVYFFSVARSIFILEVGLIIYSRKQCTVQILLW